MPVKGIMPRIPELGFETEGEFMEGGTCRGRDEGISAVGRKYLREGGKRTEVSGCFGYSLREGLCMRTRVRDSSIKGQYKRYCCSCQWKHSCGSRAGAPAIPPAACGAELSLLVSRELLIHVVAISGDNQHRGS